MTPEEVTELEAHMRKTRAMYGNQALAWRFNKAWQRLHNRTFMQACERSWRGVTKHKEHGGRYHKALDSWLAEQ